MPQDIPVEASETLVFTPECFEALPSPPKFTLRTPTTREKRQRRRLINEECAVRHDAETMRAEMLAGLKALWGEKGYAEHAPIVEAYWQALDDHALQLKDDPELKWEYDPEIEAAVERLEIDVGQAHRPFGKMRADNMHFDEVATLSIVAVMIQAYTGIDAAAERERGYLTLNAAHELRDALGDIEDEHKIEPRGRAWTQLFVACSKRMFLSEDEEKNSASPSPSETTPPISKPGKAGTSGASPASASSTETPESA